MIAIGLSQLSEKACFRLKPHIITKIQHLDCKECDIVNFWKLKKNWGKKNFVDYDGFEPGPPA